jgi:copper resistance protein B
MRFHGKRTIAWLCTGIMFGAATTGRAQEVSGADSQHVPPDPPQNVMPAMPYKAMASLMQMDDTAPSGKALLDQLEWRNTDQGAAAAWEAEGWYGGDYNKLWIKTEGEEVGGATQAARIEGLWDRVITRWWDLQLGVRQNLGDGPGRTWLAVGFQGLAPYWFDFEATVYVGDAGRTAARVKTEYEILITQRLILQPEVEANLYGRADRAQRIGSGLSDLDAGIRLRYEVRRELAPYVGLAWQHRFGGTADLDRAVGEAPRDVQVIAGIRIWF